MNDSTRCERPGCDEAAVLFPLGRDGRLHDVCVEHEREGAARGDWKSSDGEGNAEG